MLQNLLKDAGITLFSEFATRFEQTAHRLAEETGEAQLATASVSRSSYRRWLEGKQVPQGKKTTRVLYAMFSVPMKELVGAAPAHAPTRTPRCAHRVPLLNRWNTSEFTTAAPASGADSTWWLSPAERGNLFRGVSLTAQLYRARQVNDTLLLAPEYRSHLRAFVQPANRTVVLAAPESTPGEDIYLLDSGHVRRQLAAEPPQRQVTLPRSYRLDALTYGITWALANLDAALLTDDAALAGEQQELNGRFSAPRSVARTELPHLSRIGAAWLGSHVCAQHLTRQLQGGRQPPQFWCREQYGEEAAAALFFRDRHQALEATSRLGAPGTEVGGAFCLPETIVMQGQEYERILTFLSLALLERRGITTWVCTDPEYSQVDAVTLLPEHRAIVANWLRAGGDIWHVDTVEARPHLRDYAQTLDYVRQHTAVPGSDPAARLRSLAYYLELDWPELVVRCRELGQDGVAGLFQPHSRHLTLKELDAVLSFVGGLDPAL
ncbi:hypothetical protein ACFU99_11115 [Streptomyces sp. NPDC057654]|uniref:hypothetical protein n=1 Tax=Streptomyces sp. NPDC057654 TaxID=3346196 RepID=UPI0036C04E9E